MLARLTSPQSWDSSFFTETLRMYVPSFPWILSQTFSVTIYYYLLSILYGLDTGENKATHGLCKCHRESLYNQIRDEKNNIRGTSHSPTSTPPNKVKELILKFFRVLLAHFPAVVKFSACSFLLFWITCGIARRTEAWRMQAGKKKKKRSICKWLTETSCSWAESGFSAASNRN